MHSKTNFFLKGVANSKRSDYHFEIRRCVNNKIVKDASPETKKDLEDWVNRCGIMFDAFREEILMSLK